MCRAHRCVPESRGLQETTRMTKSGLRLLKMNGGGPKTNAPYAIRNIIRTKHTQLLGFIEGLQKLLSFSMELPKYLV